MGFYEAQVLPRVMDRVLGNDGMADVRRPSLQGLEGVVLEIGFGSGPNLPLYPDAVTRVLAVDPAVVGRKLAEKRLAASPIPVEFIGLDGTSLPLDDASVDSALSTWTLCTIPRVDLALREVGRVLKPGGSLFFLEHGLAADPKVAARQRRFTPLQRKIAGGCRLDRDIGALVADAGFDVVRLKNFSISGPKTMSYMYTGIATKPG